MAPWGLQPLSLSHAHTLPSLPFPSHHMGRAVSFPYNNRPSIRDKQWGKGEAQETSLFQPVFILRRLKAFQMERG